MRAEPTLVRAGRIGLVVATTFVIVAPTAFLLVYFGPQEHFRNSAFVLVYYYLMGWALAFALLVWESRRSRGRLRLLLLLLAVAFAGEALPVARAAATANGAVSTMLLGSRLSRLDGLPVHQQWCVDCLAAVSATPFWDRLILYRASEAEWSPPEGEEWSPPEEAEVWGIGSPTGCSGVTRIRLRTVFGIPYMEIVYIGADQVSPPP